MRTDDIYFKPGDKVMRVGSSYRVEYSMRCESGIPQFGNVYCVESFWEGPQFNVVMLVGFGGWRYSPNGDPVGWRAINFRSVEEIKTCLKAVQNAETPSTADTTTS